MTEPIKSIDQFARSAGAWIGLGGAVFGVLSFFMLLGMWYGPLKELPAQYDAILGKLSMMERRMDETGWAMDVLKARIDVMNSQITSGADDRSKLWDRLRTIEAEALHLKATSLPREDMIEWMAAIGASNKTLLVPVLPRNK